MIPRRSLGEARLSGEVREGRTAAIKTRLLRQREMITAMMMMKPTRQMRFLPAMAVRGAPTRKIIKLPTRWRAKGLDQGCSQGMARGLDPISGGTPPS